MWIEREVSLIKDEEGDGSIDIKSLKYVNGKELVKHIGVNKPIEFDLLDD